jgi:hypothetical protein
VLAFFVITATGQQGLETSARVAGVYDLEHGKIRRAHIFADRTEAPEAVGLSDSRCRRRTWIWFGRASGWR